MREKVKNAVGRRKQFSSVLGELIRSKIETERF